ncbi:IPT/TIG domain-containing protein [Algibacter sp. R77976]|uniref:IPT/TIG domain-containing protein n=1 Tax=Algibacter sp. R77976 TaxID=3093873 RepID=UPI0037C5035C
MRKHKLISLLLFLIISESIWAQLMLKEVPLNQQIEKSSFVVEGKVISKTSFWDINHEKIYSVNTIEVYKVFKGDPSLIIEVITPGGVVDSDAQIVYPSLKLSVNDVGVFTLFDNLVELESQPQSNIKQFKAYGSVQGFYKYDFPKNIAVNQFTSKQGIIEGIYKEIKRQTKTDYIQLSDFDVESKLLISNKVGGLLIEVSSFSPTTLSSGTKSILTINGSNFGTIKGNVGFRNADNGGKSFIYALDAQVLSWEDTKITVEVPSEAGTGEIRITHNDGSNFTSSNTL